MKVAFVSATILVSRLTVALKIVATVTITIFIRRKSVLLIRYELI